MATTIDDTNTTEPSDEFLSDRSIATMSKLDCYRYGHANGRASRDGEVAELKERLGLLLSADDPTTVELRSDLARLRANSLEAVAHIVAREAERLDEAYEFSQSEAYGDVAYWLSQQAASQAPQGGEEETDTVDSLREELGFKHEELLTEMGKHEKTLSRLATVTRERDSATTELSYHQQLVEEVRATFRKHNLAAGPTAIDRLVEQRDSLTRELTEVNSKLPDAHRAKTSASRETPKCRRCGGDGMVLSEVSRNGEASCGACRGTGVMNPDDKWSTGELPIAKGESDANR